jgi:hypothetical protein
VGTGVMGGMIAATFLAIFFVPMFFKVITARRLRERRSTGDMLAEARRVREAGPASGTMSDGPAAAHPGGALG